MTGLPITPFELTGGCFYSAIRYTISIPPFESRPPLPSQRSPNFGPQTDNSNYFPLVSLDHCNSCRLVAATLVQGWIICPTSWIQFSLQPKSPENSSRIEPTIETVLKGDKELHETTYLASFRSSEFVSRAFCGKCGAHLTYDCSDKPGLDRKIPRCDITLGSLDKKCLEMKGMRSCMQTWLEDGIDWVKKMVVEGEKGI